ncbi:substrate-binding periplasmic protein [Planctobacterium marinum]|uniref:Solute-binding protein family 3/N-terminal domain-containing protein n=1 Tax=Planctobacterium marinum TaxID=1631968 RepID=A0AA48HPV6_9ALTE|nr:hypothetical protein MACH26_13250 [Planctobacterium marinum]
MEITSKSRSSLFLAIVVITFSLLSPLSIAATDSKDVMFIGVHERINYREKSANGLWSGIDIMLLDAIFAHTPYRYELVELPWQRTLSSLQQGKVDMALSAALLPEREQYAWFTNEVFREGHNVLFSSKAKSPLFEHIESLSDIIDSDIRLGVVRGVSYSDEYDALKSDPRFTRHLIYLSETTPLADMLMHDRIDAFLDSEYGGLKMISQNPEYQAQVFPVQRVTSPQEAQTYLMFSKKTVSPEMTAKFDKAIKSLKADGSYQAILSH